MSTTLDELTALITTLSPDDQRRLLSFARALANPPAASRTPLPPGTPGHVVAKPRVSPEVGVAMEKGTRSASGYNDHS